MREEERRIRGGRAGKGVGAGGVRSTTASRPPVRAEREPTARAARPLATDPRDRGTAVGHEHATDTDVGPAEATNRRVT